MKTSNDRRRFLRRAGRCAVLAAPAWLLQHMPARAAQPARADAVTRSDAEWKALLGPERHAVLRRAGTERPYSSPLNNEKRAGTFACAGCSLPLFASAAKFDSGTGWPSFFQALPAAVAQSADHSLGMRRDEVLCARCGGHLGHVFNDGPPPTRLRYCINGLALAFVQDARGS